MKRLNVRQPEDEQEAIRTVEQALYMRAVGFVQKEEKTVTEDDGKGGYREKREVVMKQVPPDSGCIMTWLKDKQRERWGAAQGEARTQIQVISEAMRPDGEAETQD